MTIAVTQVAQSLPEPLFTVNFKNAVPQRCCTISEMATTEKTHNRDVAGILSGENDGKVGPNTLVKL